MKVSQAKQIARQWALEQVAASPAIQYVFLAGSVNHLKDSDMLPSESDVDIYLVVDDDQLPEATQRKFEYHGILLEPSYHPKSAFSSPSRVLENFIYAFHLSVPSVVYDPNSKLTSIQKEVEAGYADLHWVELRCQRIMDNAFQQHIPNFLNAAQLYQRTFAFIFITNCAIQLPLAATLRPPTVKRALMFFRDLCEKSSAQALHESYLKLLGSASMEKRQIQDYLSRCTAAFDFAIPIRKTVFPLSHCATEEERTYLIGGSDYLIRAGYFKDSIPWILLTWSVAVNVMQIDGRPEAVKSLILDYQRFLVDLGLVTDTDIQTKALEAKLVMEQSMNLAKSIIASNSAIRR
jgi:hypothetical protein